MRTGPFWIAALLSASCGVPGPQQLPPRDWSQDPSVIELEAPSVLYAVSDVHGAYDRITKLLSKNGLLREIPESPSLAVWSGGDATLVVAGDLFDKGPDSLAVTSLFMALESSAASSGGLVITLLGNHEAEFFANPQNDKAIAPDGVSRELVIGGIQPEDFAVGDDPRADWLRRRPFAARVGSWFFAHAGNTEGRSIQGLRELIEEAVDRRGFGDPDIIGNDSLLEAKAWTSGDDGLGSQYAAQVFADHIVFGHNPNALGARGQIAVADQGALLRIDCGMAPSLDNSNGVLLRVRTEGGVELAEALDAQGYVTELWRNQ